MKSKRFIHIALIGAVALLAAACQEKEITTQDDLYRPAGSKISFTAETGYDNGIETKAEYSGALFGSSPKRERIDWKSGDAIQIIYNGSAGDFTVSGTPTNTDANSVASFNGSLAWSSTGPHTFYALYPSASDGGKAGQLTAAGVVSGTIPATQNVDPYNTLTVDIEESGSTISLTKYQPNTAQYGYLVSYKQIESNSTESTVHLKFKPAFTTFEFRLRRNPDHGEIKISSVELSSASGTAGSDLTGSFSLSITGGDDYGATWNTPTVSGGARKITVGFPEGGVSVPTEGYLDFSILALPVDQTGLTLKLNYVDGTSKSIKLMEGDPANGNWYTFTGAKKYIITNVYVPGSSWVYTLTEVDPLTGEAIPVTNMVVATPSTGHGGHIGAYPATALTKPFKSYKTKADDNTVNQLVDVTIEYSPANDDGTCADNWTTDLPDWLSDYDVTSRPADTAPTDAWMSQADFIAVPVKELHPEATGLDKYEVFNEIKESKERIQALSARSQFTETKPQDLALYDIDQLNGSPRSSGKPKTANCYVVDRKGWYMFPLVYGNAIDWDWASENGWNTTSWRVALNDHTFDNYYMGTFQNYVAGWISSPYILNDVSLTVDDVEAIIVWEDAETPFILPATVQVFNPYTESTTKYVAENGSTKEVVPYIRFQVNDNIMQGNAVIALREKSGDKRIIWSWHIWVTDLDMGTQNVSLHSGAVVSSNDFMKYNLGWCDMRIGRMYSYVPRLWYVRISHDDPASNCEPLVFTVEESLDPYYTITQSSGTYYQLFRKDPFLPGTSYEGLTWGDLVSIGPNYSNEELNVAPHVDHYPQRYINKPVYAPEYSITSGVDKVKTVAATSAMDDMKHVIQNPNVYYDRNDATTMTWLYNKRPWNLWNMYAHQAYNQGNLQWHANGTEADYSPDYRYDMIVVKTIYDPCPPGFSVPNYTAFTGFTTSGTDLEWRDTGGAYHQFNPPVTWVPEDAEHFFDIDLYGDYRWYFSTNDGTICFPGHGYRSAGQVAGLFGGLYMPTVQKKGDRYVVCLSGWGPVGAGNSRATAYGVRAIKEQPRPMGYGTRVQGQGVLINDYSGNNWD